MERPQGAPLVTDFCYVASGVRPRPGVNTLRNFEGLRSHFWTGSGRSPVLATNQASAFRERHLPKSLALPVGQALSSCQSTILRSPETLSLFPSCRLGGFRYSKIRHSRITRAELQNYPVVIFFRAVFNTGPRDRSPVGLEDAEDVGAAAHIMIFCKALLIEPPRKEVEQFPR